MSALYGPPPNTKIDDALNIIFQHYSTPWKTSIAEVAGTRGSSSNNTNDNTTKYAMDNVSFNKMCIASPGLAGNLGRTDVDIIFQKCKPINTRRFEFEHFLDALLELSLRLYPDDEPIKGFSLFLAKYIFVLFDQPPVPHSFNVVDMIYEQLSLKSQ
jgi:hypothetical protein